MERQVDTSVELLEHNEVAPLINGVVIGVLAKPDDSGVLLVDYPSNSTGHVLPARSIVKVRAPDAGREVVLMFEEGDPEKPIIMGFLHGSEAQQSTLFDEILAKAEKPPDVKLDGETLMLAAQKEVVIRCGKASITLTRAGKVLIRGTYLLSRSSGVNRIKGGSVQVN